MIHCQKSVNKISFLIRAFLFGVNYYFAPGDSIRIKMTGDYIKGLLGWFILSGVFLFAGVQGQACADDGDFWLNLANYKVYIGSRTGYVQIYDPGGASLFRLGGFEDFCFDCFRDVFDKESLVHTLDTSIDGNETTLTFNVSNPAIDLTQIYEFNNLRSDFDYTFYYTFKKSMKMRDQWFLMDYKESYLEDFNDGIADWDLADIYGVGSILVNEDPNYSRSGNSLHILMNKTGLPYGHSFSVKSHALPSNMGDKEILTFWVYPTEDVNKLRVMVMSSTGDTNYRYKDFALEPLRWNKIEWNYQRIGTNVNQFNMNDIRKVGFCIYDSWFTISQGHWYIDNIKFTDDNFDDIQVFDASNHVFKLLSSGGRATYYAPRLVKTSFKNSNVSLLVSSRYSEHGQVERIDSGDTQGVTIPHFYTFSIENHRFRVTYDDDGNYLNGVVLMNYDPAKEGYSYGGKLNFKLNPDSNGVSAAKFPRNYEAAYTFTDDTDSSTQDTTKGAYFGTSNEADPSFGRKGLYGHDIKILATAFNYGSWANSWTDGSLQWLKELAAFGFEVGPHNFANVDSGVSRNLIDNLLTEFTNNFKVYTTVEHSNLCYNFSALGRIETVPYYYWLDLFENSPDTKYVFSGSLCGGDRNAYKDPWELPRFNGRLDYLGNPKRLYIYGRESSCWGWIYQGAGWGVDWNPARIDELISQKGFAHIYIHSRHYLHGMCYTDGGGAKVIYQDADNQLGYLEQKMNQGDLWIEPPHIIFDYMLDKENIDVAQGEPGTNEVTVTNHNDKAISGLTIEVYDANISWAKIGSNYQIFVKGNKVTLPVLAASESVCVKIMNGDTYSVSLPRLSVVSPNVNVDSATFDGNNIVVDVSATGRGYQDNRHITIDTANTFSHYDIYVDGLLYDHDEIAKTCTITMPVTAVHEIVIIGKRESGRIIVINGESIPCSLAELDGLNPVNFDDFAILASHWLETGTAVTGGIDGDGTVGFKDLLILSECWMSWND